MKHRSFRQVENFLGTDRKAQLAGALDVASSAAETLSGDLFGALGAGFMSGANEVGPRGFEWRFLGIFEYPPKKESKTVTNKTIGTFSGQSFEF